MNKKSVKVKSIPEWYLKGTGAMPGVWPSRMTGAPLSSAVGGAGGALIGSALVAPVVHRLFRNNADKNRLRLAFGIMGALAGAAPGLLMGSARKGITGNFSGRLDDPGIFEKDSMLGNVPGRLPMFPVGQSIKDVENNPFMDRISKALSTEVIREAGDGEDRGLADAGDLRRALPRVISNAIPTVGGAYLAAKALGASGRLKNTALGAALIGSALTGFLGGR